MTQSSQSCYPPCGHRSPDLRCHCCATHQERDQQLSEQSSRHVDDLHTDALREVEQLLALAELLREGLNRATSHVAGLSFENDDPMHRTAECLQFAWRQSEDVIGGLARASDRIRDHLRIPRRFPGSRRS